MTDVPTLQPSGVPSDAAIIDQVIDEHDRAFAALDEGPITEVYPGRSPERQEKLDHEAEEAAAKAADSETANDRIRIARLEQQLAESNALLTKLLQSNGLNIQAIAAGAAAVNRADQIRHLFHAIRKSGQLPIVQVNMHENPAQNTPVKINIDGKVWEIPRGRAVRVPVEVWAVLDAARIEGTRFRTARTPNAGVVTPDGFTREEPYSYHRFPYALLSHYEEQKACGLLEDVVGRTYAA